MTTRELKTPIVVDGKTIKAVTVTEPTFDDILEIGVPEDAKTTAEKAVILKKYVCRCTGLPESTVGQLKASDAFALLNEVAGFFTEAG